MTVQELEIRIQKKEQEIAKREKNLLKYIEDPAFVEMCDRFFETEDKSELEQYRKSHGLMWLPEYYSKRFELEEAKKTLVKYHKLLEAEQAKQRTISDMPEVIIQFRDNLIEKWDKFDEWKKEEIRKDYRTWIEGAKDRKEYLENRVQMHEKWGAGYYEFMWLTSEQIHKANVNAVNQLVLNLIERTVEIVGKITDTGLLYINQDNQGYSIINGLVIGEKGKARVESIGAGGYNIQRYHIRVLVKEVK